MRYYRVHYTFLPVAEKGSKKVYEIYKHTQRTKEAPEITKVIRRVVSADHTKAQLIVKRIEKKRGL